MFDSKRNVRLVLAGLTLVLLLAAGTAVALAQTPSADTPAADTTPAAAGTPAAPAGGAGPSIPHPVAGHEDCLSCHVEATPAPGGAAATGAAPAIPHEIAGREKCNTCHAVGTGMKPEPADHEGRTEELCLDCHTSASGEKVTLPPCPQRLRPNSVCSATARTRP